MSADHFAWSATASTERPMTLTLRLSNSGLILAMKPSSVVHTGVKSLGCENSTAQELPIQSWKRTTPSVVSASKFGAVSPICRVITVLLSWHVSSFRALTRPSAIELVASMLLFDHSSGASYTQHHWIARQSVVTARL